MKSARLGRGLSALIADIQAPGGNALAGPGRIPLDLLDVGPFQPRSAMETTSLEELAESIRAQGLLQPILVRPHPTDSGRYEIIAGERRWRAAGLAGLHEIPAVVRSMTNSEAALAALVENLQRENLNPIEEADGLQRLASEFDLTHEAIGYAIGKSRSHIANMIRLLKLPAAVRDAVREGTLTFGHARALLGHPDPESAMQEVIRRKLSVRETEALVGTQSAPDAAEAVTVDADNDASVVLLGGKAGQDEATGTLEKEIEGETGYRVKIAVKRGGRGSIAIHFANLDQLEDIRARLRRE
jgi:ParB family transcriptional regulator, chromosome partitioning protein